MNQGFAAHVPKMFIHDRYTDDLMEKVLKRQKLLISKIRHDPEFSPGSIQLLEDENTSKKVICLFAQYGMGTPYSYTNKDSAVSDSFDVRQEWFKLCLDQVAQQVPLESTLAMPFQIGCGLAGGDWQVYNKMITEWAAKHPTLHLTMYEK